jgi:hypothetical protein
MRSVWPCWPKSRTPGPSLTPPGAWAFTPSAVSQQIGKLERHVGCQLAERAPGFGHAQSIRRHFSGIVGLEPLWAPLRIAYLE